MKKNLVVLILVIVMVFIAVAGCGAPANSISGMWYEESGFGGTINFNASGTFTMDVMGMSFDGSYTFDAANSEGTMSIEIFGEKSDTDFSLENGKLVTTDGTSYTRDKVEQQSLDDMMESLGDAMQGLTN